MNEFEKKFCSLEKGQRRMWVTVMRLLLLLPLLFGFITSDDSATGKSASVHSDFITATTTWGGLGSSAIEGDIKNIRSHLGSIENTSTSIMDLRSVAEELVESYDSVLDNFPDSTFFTNYEANKPAMEHNYQVFEEMSENLGYLAIALFALGIANIAVPHMGLVKIALATVVGGTYGLANGYSSTLNSFFDSKSLFSPHIFVYLAIVIVFIELFQYTRIEALCQAPTLPKTPAKQMPVKQVTVAPTAPAPKVETPVAVAPTAPAPKVETPVAVAPTAPAPKVETPVAVAPTATAPKVETPVASSSETGKEEYLNFCPSCGTKNDNGDPFCSKCGRSLKV
ncbi:MAG: zinc-ribbon domain-containing protein [Eubacteriales bacterium]